MGKVLRIAAISLFVGTMIVTGRAARRPIEWTAYAGDGGGSKYSVADQITSRNVRTLVPAWTYRTGDFGVGRAQARDETTPIYVGGVLFVSTPFGGVRALDGETGRERWAFDAELDLSGDYGDFTNRGVSTWLDPSAGSAAPCRRRIFVTPVDARLIALDARSGAPCADFGEHGQIRLDRGLSNAPAYKSEYSITSPPAVVNGLLVVGSSVSDGGRAAAPNGIVRAFDARTGALKWTWDPVARQPSDAGYDTWRGASAHITGAANAWSIISVDEARDLVFVPVGSASPDFYGGERLGQNLFANSLVALRASTGERVWHFQAVHHDLWDYDIPAQPALFTMHRSSRDIPAIAQPTKMGFLFILNRETGAPLFPIEERAVPPSDVPGEEAWPTQPFPTMPPPLVPTHLTPDEAFGVTAESRAWCRDRIASLRSDGIFTPPSVRGSLLYPGNVGGSNWSGASIDPVRHLAFLPLNRLATLVELIPREVYRAEQQRSGRDYEVAPQAGTPFAMRRQTPFAGPDGVPCTAPPYGALAAVDLDSGELKWNVPFGRVDKFAVMAGGENWGSPNLGGSLATAGGLVFAGGAMDQRLYAFDSQSGSELWSVVLPAGVHAAPMTYVTSAGRQFVVVTAGGHRDLGTQSGDFVTAFALPASNSTPPALTIAPGHYKGRMILDRTRATATIDVTAENGSASIALVTQKDLRGRGTGRITGGSAAFDLTWQFAPKQCEGTMHLTGTSANMGATVVGEVSYKDGCDGNKEKRGTFAVWRGARAVTSLSR